MPCDNGATFKTLTHELVHAVQIQSQVAPQVFMWKWLTCLITHGVSNYYDNCYEKEAREFEDLIVPNNTWVPCTCSFPDSPFDSKNWFGPQLNQTNFDNFKKEFDKDPERFKKTSTRCSLADCFGDNIFDYAKGIIALGISMVTSVAASFFFEGPVASITTIVGAIGGMLTGLAAGLGYGGLVAGGLISGVVGAVIGLIGGAFALGLLGAIVDWVAGLFPTSMVGGSLNIVHSTDKGLSFKPKVTIERSKEQPALTASEDRLFLAWTGTTSELNVFVAPDKTKVVFEESGPCGPALSYLGQLFIGWKGAKNGHPNCMSSVDGVGFGSHFMSQGYGPDHATPGIAAGPSRIYMAWVGHDNYIRLINLVAGNPITEKPIAAHQLNFMTGHQQTPALAFGDGVLYLAWATHWHPHYLNIARFPLFPDGSIDFSNMTSNATNDFVNDTTGPAISYSSKDKRLYMAFTGADDGIWVISSPNGGQGWDKRVRLENELSRPDAGPAITTHPSTGTVFLCWVGQDGE